MFSDALPRRSPPSLCASYVPAYSLQQPKLPAVTPVSFQAPTVLQQALVDAQVWLQKLHPALVAAWAGAAALTALSAGTCMRMCE